MDIRFLESFISVVENGSIAAASRGLSLTSAAVSQRIKALESELGIRLVLRSGRNVKPTQAGVAILDQARSLIRSANDLKALANRALGGEIRLGAISSAVTGLLPDILERMALRHSDIGVKLIPGLSDDLYRRVIDGELDAAILVEQRQPRPKSCAWAVLREEPLIVLAHASMAGRPPQDLLATQPYIRYRRNECGRLADEYLRDVGIQPQMIFELDGLEAIAQMVDRGLGVSVAPDWARADGDNLAIAKIALPNSRYLRKIGLLWNQGSGRAALVQPFLTVALQVLKAASEGTARAPSRTRMPLTTA